MMSRRVVFIVPFIVFCAVAGVGGVVAAHAVMPNAPRHQLGFDAEYRAGRHWVAGLGVDAVSSWYIDPSNQASTDAYALVNSRVAYRWSAGSYAAEITAAARNLFGTEYIAFTEPDPDGNSYQPGPTREFFVGMRLRFGR